MCLTERESLIVRFWPQDAHGRIIVERQPARAVKSARVYKLDIRPGHISYAIFHMKYGI
jgi:hypothetical protein